MGGYLSSSPFGWPDVPGSIGIYQTSAVNRVNKPVGEYLQVGLRGFRFAKNGATELAKGKLTCAAAIATDDPDLINIVVTATAAAGDYVVKATVTATNATTIAANAYKDGHLFVVDNAGEGQTFTIKAHPAVTIAAAGSATLEMSLYDPVFTALTTASEVIISRNPYNGTIVHPAAVTGYEPTGWPLITIPANEFYWSLVWGPVAALADANPPTAIHQGVIPSDATIGAIEIEASGSVTRRVGYAMLAGASGEYYPIFATIG